MTLILAIDLGKSKSAACICGEECAAHHSVTGETRPDVWHDVIVECEPAHVVIETGAQAGWINRGSETLAISLAVANTTVIAGSGRRIRRDVEPRIDMTELN